MNTNRDQLLEAAGLRVRFFWRGDRYAHEIWLLDGGDWFCALASVEGSPQDDWPASPPLQALHVERRDDLQRVALLVGMAGKSHWSASAQIDPHARCASFDVACRVRGGQTGPLGSAYRNALESAGPDANHRRLEIEPFGPLGSAQLEHAGEIVRVVVGVPADAAFQTIRWGYRLWPAGGGK